MAGKCAVARLTLMRTATGRLDIRGGIAMARLVGGAVGDFWQTWDTPPATEWE